MSNESCCEEGGVGGEGPGVLNRPGGGGGSTWGSGPALKGPVAGDATGTEGT